MEPSGAERAERSRAEPDVYRSNGLSRESTPEPCYFCRANGPLYLYPEPHAPSALLELSSLDPGLGARAQDERRAASIARGSRRTRSEKRSGWDYASVGHLVCLV